ncbi:putative SOS response-associated peptidase YedK [Microbacterium ginsengiterrae]|uniref:Abasic site processing protein n=1 Tax=Microbacterium ginsengiterrae TaxID=546115 RepID=A0A7W9FA87_9MICO|nr:SOS response-associated peptidase family protein [Microbacterium ginsengiterrae]MBB5742001.1 putative SOS response-associated peptidase YedK [Microbacterium ginsengiterrae]
MCASYGLDPRFSDTDLLAEADAELLDDLRGWARDNDGETLRPTGKNLRNLNPLIVPQDEHAALEKAWWGYLIDGQPSKFPSINTRSERLQDQPAKLRTRAIVPTTGWFEMRKPERVWHEFTLGPDTLFGMAAVTQRGRTPDGDWVTCYSIVMAPAPAHLAEVHERMPVLIPASMSSAWLTAAPDRDLIDEALAASAAMAERISVTPTASRP